MARTIAQYDITLGTSTGHTKQVCVEVAVDMHVLANELGRKAANSKGQKAIECGGAVVVKVLK
jgi:hypothetical protein